MVAFTMFTVLLTVTPSFAQAPGNASAGPATPGQAAVPGGGLPGTSGRGATGAPVANTPPTGPHFIIGDANVVRVPAAATTLTFMNAPGLDKLSPADIAELASTLGIKDSGAARGISVDTAVAFQRLEFIGRTGATGLTWRVEFAPSVMPASLSHQRLATATIGVSPAKQSYAIEYTLTSKPANATQWAVQGQSDIWTVSWGDAVETRVFGVTITSPDDALSNLRIVQSSLKDASGTVIGVNRLSLVVQPDDTKSGGFAVPAGTPKSAYLRLENGSWPGPFGTFDGVVRFAIDGSTATKEVSLKLQASSVGQQVLGILLAFAGLMLSIYVAALLRPKLGRLQALRAAAVISDAVVRFESELTATCQRGVSCPEFQTRIAALEDAVSETTLDRDSLLPPGSTWLPGATPAAGPSAALKARIDDTAKILEGLIVLLRNGVVDLLDRMGPAAAAPFIKQLDTAAKTVKGPEDARATVDSVRKAAAGGKESGAPIVERGRAVQTIDLQMQTLSARAGLIWAGVSLVIAIGWITTDVDYGTALDLTSSFLWGFGMTTFGASIQQLTPANVSSQFTVKAPQ